jgi:hypothetical protein
MQLSKEYQYDHSELLQHGYTQKFIDGCVPKELGESTPSAAKQMLPTDTTRTSLSDAEIVQSGDNKELSR